MQDTHKSVNYRNSPLGGCIIADLNADGKKDLIVEGSVTFPSGNYKYVRIYWGMLDTLVLNDKLELRGLNESGVGIASFDVNGDGIDDFLWTDSDSAGALSYVKVYFGGYYLKQTQR